MEYSITIFAGPPRHHQGPGTMLSSSTSGDHPLHYTGGRFYMETICPRSWNSTSKPSSAFTLANTPWSKWSVPTAVLAWNAHSLPWTPWSALCCYGKWQERQIYLHIRWCHCLPWQKCSYWNKWINLLWDNKSIKMSSSNLWYQVSTRAKEFNWRTSHPVAPLHSVNKVLQSIIIAMEKLAGGRFEACGWLNYTRHTI